MIPIKRGYAVILALAVALMPATLAEDDRDDDRSGSRPWDRLAVRLGGFAVSFDTNIRVDSDTLGVGTEIDLEDDTNLDRNKTEANLSGHISFGRRHRLEYGAVLFRRSASTTIDRQIQVGDTVFNVNADVVTEFRNDVIKLAYRYDVVRRPAWDLGLLFGVSAFITDLTLSANAAGGGMVEKEDFVAPMPVLGLHADVRLAKKWYLRARGEIFDFRLDDQKGSLNDGSVAIDWYPFKNVGFGFGFNRSRLSYEDLGTPEIDVTYTYSGTTLYVSYVR